MATMMAGLDVAMANANENVAVNVYANVNVYGNVSVYVNGYACYN